MDYKKAYEDALERAKGIYNENPSSSTAKFVCGQIFPEIKESKDERIRKELWEYFHNLQLSSDCDFSPSFTIDDILAYLEKQKEKQPAEWSEEDETAYGDLIWCIEQAKKSAKDENDMGNIWFAENWVKNRLKSIRPQPHWKPTYKQMAAIEECLRFYTESTDTHQHLKSLLNNLKDL